MPKSVYIAAALCLYAIAGWVYFPSVEKQPYYFDEADYMWAGKQGFWANYWDPHGLTFADYVTKGLELVKDPSKRGSFSEYIRSSGDISMYRHYHGPIYAYWLALLQKLGVERENVFRGSGLLINFAAATIVLLGFWRAFPSLPRGAGLAACALFVFSRTILVATTMISQHGIFTLMTVVTLFAASFFFKTLSERWFCAFAAALAIAICTVETGVLLLAGFGLAMLVDWRRMKERWPTLRAFLALIGKGVLAFVAAVVVIWPKGAVQLGLAKGFMMLAYISVYRKTFSPFGPLDLWKGKFSAAPWEFGLLFAGLVAGLFLWRRFTDKVALLPWMGFAIVFLAITLKVTAPYTYYYAPLVAALVVITAASLGEFWLRWPKPWKLALPILTAASLVGQTIQYSQVAREIHDQPTYSFAVMKVVRERAVAPGQRLYIPYQLIPVLHYYLPELRTVGYDLDYPVPDVADGMAAPTSAGWAFCEESYCTALERYRPGIMEEKLLLSPQGPSGQPIYVIRIRKS